MFKWGHRMGMRRMEAYNHREGSTVEPGRQQACMLSGLCYVNRGSCRDVTPKPAASMAGCSRSRRRSSRGVEEERVLGW
uniref:Uncharacterized protein n=1 Tax=Physcomitrium patens TaxID=3218 RepID=A0A2K1ISU5_PHYPA|nr:hypothetical protein PHYPA_026477 [Physcomitrium patens]